MLKIYILAVAAIAATASAWAAPIAIGSDASGHYIFRDLTAGSYTIQASLIGYKTQTHSITITNNQSLELDFEVSPDAFMLDQVVVTSSKNEKITYTLRLFNRQNLEASAGISNILNSYQRDFDTGLMRDSGYIYGPMLPRSVNVGIALFL